MTQAAKTVRAPTAEAYEAPSAAAAWETRPPYRWAALAALAVFAFYAFTLAPTTGFWDTSEYIATAHIMGIPHPPGNPLFVLLARAWDLLLAPTGLPTAVRINLFSAFMSAGTSFFWFLVVHRILGWFSEDERVRRVGAAVSVVIAATAFTVWYQSNLNEKVYTVSMFTIAALSWLAFLWRDHVEEHRGVKGRFNDDNALVLMVFILALSVANHMMALLAVPALVVFLVLVNPSVFAEWETYLIGVVILALYVLIGEPALILGLALARPRFDRSWKLHVAMVAAFVLGLSVHLFLSIRSGIHPVINEAQPTCPSIGSALSSIISFGKAGCADLSASLMREQYQKPSITDRQAPFLYQMLNYFQYFDWQWARSVSGDVGYFGKFRQLITVLFAALGGYGMWEHFRRDRKSFLYLGTLFFTLSVGLVFYMNFKYGYGQLRTLESLRNLSPELAEVRERDYFFLVSFSLWGLWAGIGLTALWTTLAEALAGDGRRSALALAAPVLLLALVPMVANWTYASRRGDYAARDLAYNMLQSVEPYGVLFTNGDNDTFPLWYLQEVEGIRRDVTVIVLSYLNTDWYPKQLRELTKPCETPGQALSDPTRIICQRPFEAEGSPRFYDGRRAPTRSILAMSNADIDALTSQPGMVAPQDLVFEARGVQALIPAGKALYPADQLVLAIVKQAWGDRPIYFAATTNQQYDLGLYPHTVRHGLAFKLVTPQEAAGLQRAPDSQEGAIFLGGYQDPVRTGELLDRVFMFRNMPDRPVWPDDATRNIPMHYAYAFQAQAMMEQARNQGPAAQRFIAKSTAFRELAQK